jgi:hypothetical protein
MVHRERAVDAKKLRNYVVILLLALLVVSLSGCVEKSKEAQDKVNIKVYEEMGGEGDPQEQISEFYDIALEGSEPVITPLAEYAIELDAQTGEIIGVYDSDGEPVSNEKAHELKVKYADGDIITDPAQIDLHINPIGKDKYQILNLAWEMPAGDGKVWRIKGMGNDYFDEELVDNVIKVGDGWDEFSPGFIRGEDGKPYGVIIVDQDTFDLYKGRFEIKEYDMWYHAVHRQDCTLLAEGMYAYTYILPEKGAFVISPCLWLDDLPKGHGSYAEFRFVKE